MSTINAVLRPLFDIFLLPFKGFPAIVGVTVVSLIVGILMLLIFKYTSNQPAIEAQKRKRDAGLFEIRLYNDDLGAIMKAVGTVLISTAGYLRHMVIPLIVALVPLLVIMAHVQPHYGYQGLEPGEPTLFKVVVEEGWESTAIPARGKIGPRPDLQLQLPEGVEAMAPPVWIPGLREMAWRVVANAPGDYEVGVRFGEKSYLKTLSVTDALQRISPERFAPSFLDELLYTGEDPFPADSGLLSASVRYAERDVWFLFGRTHWVIAFFVLSLVFAFALRSRFDVTF